MINSEKVCNYIERKNKIKLFPSQKRFIDGLISGCDISCPRRFGRTSLIKWYTEYLNEVYANKRFSYESEIFISGKEFVQENPSYQELIDEMKDYLPKEVFEKEFVCDWNKEISR